MGLTSHKVLAIAAAAAVLAATATVRGWPRLAGPGRRAVAGRIGALLATQLAMLLALALAANSYFSFYGSWDDLLGTPAGGPVTVTTGTPGGELRVLGREPVRGGGAVGREPGASGEIQAVKIAGPRSGLSTDGYVYLPPQYFRPEYAGRRFPAVVVMTGFPGDARNLITRLNYPGAALRLNLAGRMPPTVLVLLRPSPAMPADTECEDAPGGARAETYLTRDVPAAVAAGYRVSPDPRSWAVMGNSTGGYCALKLAMRHPEVFPSAVALSGYYRAAEDASTGDLFGGSPRRREEADLLWRLRHLPPPGIAVLLAGAERGDGDYLADTRAFAAAVRAPMSLATATVPEGGHNFGTWGRLLPAALEWLAGRLRVS
ncbi:alpha/beta hydrolase-fold protein [Kitasatospora sp. NPDC049258]|uniref:alpha/beta hydrolase n=1 Tax=Kitasatospora sp. NPDC049258 TaxID=3155394 RepID=UPI00342E5CB1